MADPSAHSGLMNILPNPLADWDNDDLLLTERAREIVAAASPAAFRVLDWPALRDLFSEHDAKANVAKRQINHHGAFGALVSTIGASLLALLQLIPAGLGQNAAAVIGCIFVVGGSALGAWHLAMHGARTHWLLGRLWTERLRQFYFQYLVNNLEAAIAAMADDEALRAYRTARAGALRSFVDQLGLNLSARDPRGAIRWIAEDHEDAHTWAQTGWAGAPPPEQTPMSDHHRELFECLSYRRIGIQIIYTEKNLQKGSFSQSNLAKFLERWGNRATLLFVLLLFAAGVLIARGNDAQSGLVEALIAFSGVTAAFGLLCRLLDQGMGFSLDTERYELYRGQLELVRQRFGDARGDVGSKILALRQLEIYVYREMRQFLHVHLRSSFL